MNFTSRLRITREAAGLSQKSVAASLFITQQAYARYESGSSSPNPDTLKSIASLFNVSVDYLLGNEESPSVPTAANILPLPETYEIPLIGEIACGSPILANENVEQMVSVPSNVTADFCLRCKGDSMIGARIYDGDLVYIRQQDDVDDGQIAAVLIDDEATLKRVYRDGNNLILQAENPTYKPQIYTAKDAKNIQIIGLAVAFLSRVK